MDRLGSGTRWTRLELSYSIEEIDLISLYFILIVHIDISSGKHGIRLGV